MEFFDALFEHAFLQRAVLAGLLTSIACGVIGTWVVSRRISYLAGGVSHSLLGGIGVAHYLAVAAGLAFIRPMYGAIVFAVAAAVLIGFVSLRMHQREDTLISALWAVGMAIGVIFMYQTPGYAQDLMTYLFGNILLVSSSDLQLIAILDAFILLAGVLYFNKFLAVCFDQPFARSRGVHVEFYYIFLLVLVGLTVVLLVEVVGIIMVIALITLPAAIAGMFAMRLGQMMLWASILAMLFTFVGLFVSYTPNLPAGATIILVTGVGYLLAMIIRSLRPQ